MLGGTETDLANGATRGQSTHICEAQALLFVPIPDDDLAVSSASHRDEHFLILISAKISCHELSAINVCRIKHPLAFDSVLIVGAGAATFLSLSLLLDGFEEAADVVNDTDSLLRLLTNCQVFAIMGQGHGSDAFRALKAWDEALGSVILAVENDVVTTGVNNDVLV